jgi:hypothetical protein
MYAESVSLGLQDPAQMLGTEVNIGGNNDGFNTWVCQDLFDIAADADACEFIDDRLTAAIGSNFVTASSKRPGELAAFGMIADESDAHGLSRPFGGPA